MDRRLKQGLVLSPVLILTVIDLLHKLLQESHFGLVCYNFFVGVPNEDDIRTLATSTILEKQATLVKDANILKLNVQKCEVMMFGTARDVVAPRCVVVLPIDDVGKCWWR